MKRMLPMLAALLTAVFALMLSGCSKTPEQSGDAFMASAEKAQNPKVKEEREKKAYYKYIESVNWYTLKDKPVPASLREKLLKITLSKLNRELNRYKENSEEANVEQIQLWRADFKKYLPGLNNPQIIDGYSRFLLALADPNLMELTDVIDVLNEVISLQVRASDAKNQMKQIQGKFADGLVADAAKILEETQAALKGKNGTKDNLVMAEYKTLLALKYDPENAGAKATLSKIRELMLDTYSGYERFQDNLGGRLDPDVDKYDIYLCVPKKSMSGSSAALSVAFWNLTASPIEVKSNNFFLVTDNNDTVMADPSSRFNKILVDIKTDTVQTLNFKLPGKSVIKNLLYKDDVKVSEKFFH